MATNPNGHVMLNTSITFGMVTIPVGICAGISDQKVSFRQLHEACGTPIRHQKMCPNCECDVEMDEIIRGYEVVKGQYVTVTEDELLRAAPEAARAIEITKFVPLE